MRGRVLLAAGLLVLVGGAIYRFTRPTPPPAARPGGNPAVLHFDEDGLRYKYHLITKSEGLYDLAADPHCLKNLAADRPEELKRMRHALCRELGVSDLSELANPDREMTERLRGLGYL